jgi:myo-inositol 2-dehydrogenase / D-chiro-inositol 1-dehydrogenase
MTRAVTGNAPRGAERDATEGARGLRLGIVGCGRVTELRHLPALRGSPGVRVVALSDVDPARLASVAERFGVVRRYRDHAELIEAGGVDAVAVCVPPRHHAEVALAALAAGKHLFVEKPLALKVEECERLAARAALAPALKAMVGFNLRWHRLVREARETIGRGALGEIKLVRTVFTSAVRARADFPDWRRRRESGGGALFELGVHHFDLLRFMLRDEVEEVYASSRDADETAAVAARMGGGAQVLAAFSEGTGENHEIEIYGGRGWLRVSIYRADGLEQLGASQYPGSMGTRLRRMGRTLRELPRMVRQARRGGDYVASYAEEWRHFVSAVAADSPVGATLDDGGRALEVALAAWESSATGRAVRLNGGGSAREAAAAPPAG